MPDPATLRPELLPLVDIVSDRLAKDVRHIIAPETKFCSQQERDQMETFLDTGGDLSSLVTVTGAADAEGLPGRSGFVSCMDSFNKTWRAEVQLLDATSMPDLPWAVPQARLEAVQSHSHLTEDELKLLGRSVICTSQATPSHPRGWTGGRLLTEAEQRQYSTIGSRTKVADHFLQDVFCQQSDLDQFLVQDLKDFLRKEGQVISGAKIKLVERVWMHVQNHRQRLAPGWGQLSGGGRSSGSAGSRASRPQAVGRGRGRPPAGGQRGANVRGRGAANVRGRGQTAGRRRLRKVAPDGESEDEIDGASHNPGRRCRYPPTL